MLVRVHHLRAAPRARRSAAAVAAVTALATGAVLASAAGDSDDHYKPPGTVITATSAKAVSTAGGVTLTCTHSVTKGKTPAMGLGLFTISPPVFNDGGSPAKPCTDSAKGTDTITASGTWRVGFIDSIDDEATAEPNTGDRLELVIPQKGAVDHNSFGCVITLAPSGPVTLTGSYNDSATLTINAKNVPASVAGPSICKPGMYTGNFSATYTLSPRLSDGS